MSGRPDRAGTDPASPVDVTLADLRAWMRARGWQPLPHQEAVWHAQLEDREGLIHVPTGQGKTYAAYFGALARAAADGFRGPKIVWLTPLRATARDLEAALAAPVADLGLAVSIGARTGDTSSYRRRRLRERMPTVLVTTPESLTLLLTYPEVETALGSLDTVVVDEWHELLGSKRGTQTELALARLRRLAPGLRTWALSATVGDLEAVAAAALGPGRPAVLVGGDAAPALTIRSLLPPDDARLPWFGYIGSAMFDAVVDQLTPERSTLVFTNTRNQAERWYRAIMERRPEWFAASGLHHGSIDQTERRRVENGLADGSITLVVCTSSLDLGVDFTPVERVIQIGSPRGVARLLQRAGRSGHRPGATSDMLLVPTHAMQLLEYAALANAIAAGRLETRPALDAPLDVLVQHLVSAALPGTVDPESLWQEVRSTWAYRALARATFDWALNFVEQGGTALGAYPRYRRVARDPDGRLTVRDRRIARDHRAAVGTITGGGQIRVRYRNGREVGLVDENAVARLVPGERFLFAGRALELVLLGSGEAWVRPARQADHAPKWAGDELPLSEPLAAATRDLLAEARRRLEADGDLAPLGPEAGWLQPLLRRQARYARLPGSDRTLAEICHAGRDGSHLFLYCFAGQLAQRGLAALLAWRLARRQPLTVAIAVNDYALELHTPEHFDFRAALADPALFERDQLAADAERALNATELARRRFRRIARVAGLVQEGLPHARKSARQLQTSAGLLYDVLARHEPDNPLLGQAHAEVLDEQYDLHRLGTTLERIATDGLEIVETPRPSPMAFPLVLERASARLSTESARRRLERMQARWVDAMAAEP